MDAPVSGGPEGAKAGTLSIMVGGACVGACVRAWGDGCVVVVRASMRACVAAVAAAAAAAAAADGDQSWLGVRAGVGVVMMT